jgi:enoyl reductase
MPRATVFDAYGDPDVLRVAEIDPPNAGPGAMRIRVRAAGVNPVDAKVRSGAFARPDDAFPRRLGNELAGVVDQVGPEVEGFAVGDEVLGFTAMQAYAESVALPAEQVAHKPSALTWELAGALSAVGQTAWNALDELRVAAGETLLVHAAAGGVGTIAVQLAVARGATVLGTASERNHDYLRSLGAEPVAYGPGLVERVRALAPGGVDAVLDAIGGEAIDASLELCGDRDRIGTTVDQEAADRLGIRRLRGERSAERLAALAQLAADGALRLPIQQTFPLERAAEAHRVLEGGHVRGKLVLMLD